MAGRAAHVRAPLGDATHCVAVSTASARQAVTIDAFTAMANGLANLHRALEETRQENDSNWLPDSPAASAVAAAAGTPWGSKRIVSAYLDNQLLMLSAGDHLRSLAELMRNREFGIYSLFTLARAAAEAAARLWHIYEPDLVTEERARRAANETLMSLHDQAQGLRHAGMDDSKTLADIEQILSFARQRGLAVTSASRYREPHIGTRRERFAHLLKGILTDSEEGVNVAAVVHQQLSAVAHGTAHGLAVFLGDASPSDIEGVSNVRIRLVPGRTAAQLGAAPLAYIAAAHRTIREYGWNPSRFNEAMLPALTVWREVTLTAS